MSDQLQSLFNQSYNKNKNNEDFFAELNLNLQRATLTPSWSPIPPEDLPIIYIIGAPRSGTTLLYQLISRYLTVGYINNLIARFWLRPSVGIRLSQACFLDQQRQNILLESVFGRSPNIIGPHEFSYFWRYWLDYFDENHQVYVPKQVFEIDKYGLKNALENEILASFAVPTVFKYLRAGFYAQLLTEIHPQSIFVYMKRDEEAIVRSILSARKRIFGTYEQWFSLKPSTFPFDNLGQNPVQDVVSQVHDIYSDFDEQFVNGVCKVVKVEYEELCTHPAKVLNNISNAVKQMGVTLPFLSQPEPLHPSKPTQLFPHEIQNELEDLYYEY